MQQLRDAAWACGLEVEPIALGREGAKIDRPMVALLSGPSSNHDVLARPVPGRGSMAQVIDPRGFSFLVRQDELTSSPAWTGFVLRPRRAASLGGWGDEIAIGAIVAVATYALAAARSRRSPQPIQPRA